MTTNDEEPIRASVPEPPPSEAPAETDPVDPLEPVADDSVLGNAPDTSTGKEHLVQNDEGRPGPGV
jgi:hypothetical protein